MTEPENEEGVSMVVTYDEHRRLRDVVWSVVESMDKHGVGPSLKHQSWRDRLVQALGIKEKPRPEIICLCGSSRFVAEMAVLAWEIEKEGKIVMGLHLLPGDYPGVQSDHQAESEGIAAAMDELHLRKIDFADRVFVVNKDGYIGDSTRREIKYAKSTGKDVLYLERIE